MKKMIFTAMAVLAFSAVSVAKTGEVKEVKEKVLFTDCIAVAIAATDAADPNHKWTSEQANKFFQAILDACAASKPKELTIAPS